MITKGMSIGEIVKNYPEVVPVLMENGLRCVTCPMASHETLKQGAESHGIQLDKLVSQLNATISKK
ncbi:MAG: DUF1858 domain-containing protein [Candidatus Micrarchaeota archaeon]